MVRLYTETETKYYKSVGYALRNIKISTHRKEVVKFHVKEYGWDRFEDENGKQFHLEA